MADEAPQETAAPASRVLKTYCARCHGGEAFGSDADEGGFDFVLDRERLIAGRKLVPGNPTDSKLFVRIAKMEMPPRKESQRPSGDEIEALRRWIAAGAPPLASRAAAAVRRDFISLDRVERLIFEDLNSTDEELRPNLRYFTLTNAWNARMPDEELESRRHALTKLLNSLTWSPAIVAPKAIDPQRTIFRVDLRDLRWDGATWDAIVARYPYGIERRTMIGKAIYDTMKTGAPYVRADWFVAEASHPPLYHQILNLPESAADLEARLGVVVSADRQAHKSPRAAFQKSGISRNNRLIERHETRHGAYWRSYDFANNEGTHNLFQHPLGPAINSESFEPDGGEIIFSLPNGLHGYMLVNRLGGRIDQAPTEIVSDPGRPDRRVDNGLSCMGCHNEGIVPKDDEMRAYIEQTPPGLFNAAVRAEVLDLYPPTKVLHDLQDRDRYRYLVVLQSSGVGMSEKEPVSLCARAFEQDLDLATTAAELGVEQEQLRRQMTEEPKSFAPLAPLLVDGGTIRRTVFLSGFKDAVTALRLGRPVGGDALIARTSSQAAYCGLEGTVAERIEGCRLLVGAEGMKTAKGWTLVSLAKDMQFVWRHDATGLLWTGQTGGTATRARAETFCGQAGHDAFTANLSTLGWRLPGTEEMRIASAAGVFHLAGWRTFEGNFWLSDQQRTSWKTVNIAVAAGEKKLIELESYAQASVVCVANSQ